MKVDAVLAADPARVGDDAAHLEEQGFDGLFVPEGAHDAFIAVAAAAPRTTRVDLGTSIAIAFARTPMTLAHVAYDLQWLTGGRFVLGLGSQIRPHITRRYGMPWSRPAARMRELVEAVRAIWRSWHEGERLDFRGDFYTHTLMTPMFDPGPHPHGLPPIWVAGVGARMTEGAGEVADGFIAHPMCSPAFLREVTLPALSRGAARSGRSVDQLTVAGWAMVATGLDENAMEAAVRATRAQIAFYGSTPAYRPVLDLHGVGDLHPELNRLSKTGDWAAMAGLVDDELLHTLAVVAEPDAVAREVRARYGGLLDRVTLSLMTGDRSALLPAVAALRG